MECPHRDPTLSPPNFNPLLRAEGIRGSISLHLACAVPTTEDTLQLRNPSAGAAASSVALIAVLIPIALIRLSLTDATAVATATTLTGLRTETWWATGTRDTKCSFPEMFLHLLWIVHLQLDFFF